jgi:hypothetical protein
MYLVTCESLLRSASSATSSTDHGTSSSRWVSSVSDTSGSLTCGSPCVICAPAGSTDGMPDPAEPHDDQTLPETPTLPEVDSPPAEDVLEGVPSTDEIIEHAQTADEIVSEQPSVDDLLGGQR